MDNDLTDNELTHDISAQEKLLQSAFATGDGSEIDKALARVTHVRQMLKNGIFDWDEPAGEQP
ncbi:MAG: hypothetical protein ABJO09_11635 [Hyphomicrobiales bacterium]